MTNFLAIFCYFLIYWIRIRIEVESWMRIPADPNPQPWLKSGVNKEEIKTAKTNCFYHLLFQAQVSWQGSAAKHEPLRQANLPCRLLHTSWRYQGAQHILVQSSSFGNKWYLFTALLWSFKFSYSSCVLFWLPYFTLISLAEKVLHLVGSIRLFFVWQVLVEGMKVVLALSQTQAFQALGTKFWDKVIMPGMLAYTHSCVLVYFLS